MDILRRLSELKTEEATDLATVLHNQDLSNRLSNDLNVLEAALDGNNKKTIRATINKVRLHAAQLNVDSQLKQLSFEEIASCPPADELDAAFVRSIESALGMKIEEISSMLRDEIVFIVDDQPYKVSPHNLFRNTANRIFGNREAKNMAKRYLMLLSGGKKQNEAKTNVEKTCKTLGERLPNHPHITREHVLALEDALGYSIEKIKPDSRDPIMLRVGEVPYYEKSLNALLQRIAVRALGGASQYQQAKKYLISIRDGVSPEGTIEIINTRAKRVPAPPNLTQEHAVAFERSIGCEFEDLPRLEDSTKRQYSVDGITFETSQTNILSLISTNILLGKKNRPAQALSYLIAIRDGESHEDALRKAEEKGLEGNRLPSPPNLNADQIIAFEQAFEIKIEDVDKRRNIGEKRRKFSCDEETFYDCPHSLLRRIQLSVFGEPLGYRQNAVRYLTSIRDGKNHTEAERIAKRVFDGKVDEEFEELSALELEDAISLLQHDPLKLKYYLIHAYPDMTEEEIDRLVSCSFTGLSAQENVDKEEEYLAFDEELPKPRFTEVPLEETEETSVVFGGKAPKGADAVYVSGVWNRRIRVGDDGSFSVRIPLEIGTENEINFMAIDRENEVRSAQCTYIVQQTGDPEEIEALFRLLSQVQSSILTSIQRDPDRRDFLVACAEQMLIRKFARSFAEGEEYVAELRTKNKSRVIKSILKKVIDNFKKIEAEDFEGVSKERPLYFFQKYCAHVIRRAIENGMPGFILANDPGLGKTSNVWAALDDYYATIISPNNVVSDWDREAGLCLNEPDVLVLQNLRADKRKNVLRDNKHSHVVTNREFLRDHEDKDRFRLLSDDETIVVADEAHSVTNLDTDQTQGLLMLPRAFLLLVSATPCKNPERACRMLHVLYPDDPQFENPTIFAKAFNENDPKALRAVNLLLRKCMVRFREKDVMETMTRDLSPREQKDRLPIKEHVPPEEFGEFAMTEKQAQAIYELFLDFDKWSRKYGKYIPDDEISREDNLRRGGKLTKKHALRQTVNNPEYIGENTKKNPKAEKIRQGVLAALEEGRKSVIFCQYNSQALRYAKMFEEYNPALYTGLVAKKKTKKNDKGRSVNYRHDDERGGWELDEATGLPIEDRKGKPMLALDYEALRFQNSDECQILICTYSAGSVGKTFTAGKAVFRDDLAEDGVQDEQSEKRTHRIDHEHLTHHDVKYHKMISKYPERFLERMKKRWVWKKEDGTYEEVSQRVAEKEGLKTAYDTFFAQGTYDAVHDHNIVIQRRRLDFIRDGISDERILQKGQFEITGLNGAMIQI